MPDNQQTIVCPDVSCSGPAASDVTGTLYCAKCGDIIDKNGLVISSFANQDAKALSDCRRHKAERILRPSTIQSVLADTYGTGPAGKAILAVFSERERESNYY